MGLFNCNKTKNQLSDLNKKLEKLQIEYEDKMDLYECSLCKQYEPGPVRYYSERFANCDDCEHCEEMRLVTKVLDDTESEISVLENNKSK